MASASRSTTTPSPRKARRPRTWPRARRPCRPPASISAIPRSSLRSPAAPARRSSPRARMCRQALRRDVANGQLKENGPDQAKVTLTLEDGTKYPAIGTLQFTDITVDPGTGSVTVRAVFPNPDHVLLPGMFVRASIEEGVNDNALLVPQTGVTHNPQGQATALVVGPDIKVELRAIQATRTSGANWVVDGGLKDGERVIVSGVQKVQPGTLVRTVDASAPKPLARTN